MPVALVTGSSRGIGREVARQLAAREVRVIVTSRRSDAAAEAAAKIGRGAIGHALDTSDAQSILDRTELSLWMTTDYMPRTRDMSASRRRLLRAWCRKVS